MKRFWQSVLLLVGISLGLLLVACAPESEPEPTAQPTDQPTAAVAEATQASPTATPEPKETPTESPTVAATATAETPPDEAPGTSFTDLGPLPVSQELEMTIVDQWGGVPRSLALDGSTAIVGFGPRLLMVDVSDPAAPELLAQSDVLPGLIHGIALDDGLAYLATGTAGLLVLDISDPTDMSIVGAYSDYVSDRQPNAERITVDDNGAYLVDFNRVDGQMVLHHFDVSDPGQLTLLGSHPLPSNAAATITDELIIVAGMDQLQLRDAVNPASIMSETPLASGNYTSRAILQGDTVTVAQCCSPSGIERFDVSDPFHPAALGPLQEVEMMPPVYVAVEGQTLVTAGTFGEFGFCQSTINFTTIDDQQSEGFATLDPENCLGDLVLDGNRLYLAGRSGLQIYDVSDPANPALLGEFRQPAGFHDAQGLARSDGFTYALSAEGRGFDLSTLDLGQQLPEVTVDRQALEQRVFLDLFVSGETLVAPIWMGSLYTLDISDPAAPQILHQPAEDEMYGGDFFTVALKDDVLYMPVVDGVSIGGVGVIDLSDPTDPVLAETVVTGVPQVLNLALSGDTLYVLSQGDQSTIMLYDVSQPLAPEQVAAVTMPEFVSRLAVVGDTLYAACDFHNCQAIYAVDVSDQQNPDVAWRWTIPFGVRDMAVDEEGTVYLVTSEQRLWSMDGRDPEQLRLTGALGLPGEFIRLKIEGDQLYAAAFEAGLYQVQIQR